MSDGLYKRISRIINNHQNYGTAVVLHRYFLEGIRIIMRFLGPLLVILASSLLLFVLYVFITTLLPSLAMGSPLLYGFHLAVGIFLIINVFFNYLSCALIPAGCPVACDEPGRYFGRSVNMIDGRMMTLENYRLEVAPFVSYKYCNKCRALKPPRTHHDSISGRCILVMDHYCPWMGSAVGYHNYRYFILFLFYMFVGALYVIFITTRELFLIPRMIAAQAAQEKLRLADQEKTNLAGHILIMSRGVAGGMDGGSAANYDMKRLAPGSQEEQLVLFVFILGVAASISVGVLLFWHIYLSITNQTTIEFYFNMAERIDAKKAGTTFKNPYDQGWRKNLKRVFGDVPWYLALSLSWRPALPPQYPFVPIEKHPDGRMEEGTNSGGNRNKA